jgi:multidrug efflux pump subunit AcrB
MAVGFGVEFCAHFTRCFMLASGSRNERMLTAYREITWPILSGGLTSFLSLLPIAFSEYSYFRVYFLGYYTLLIALALVSSLLFLPTFLALIGPPAYSPPVEECKPGEGGDLESEPKTERQDPTARLKNLLHTAPPAPPSTRSEQSSLRVHTGYTSRIS